MGGSAQHSTAKVKAYVKLLEISGAPKSLIKDFEEIIQIDNELSLGGRGYVDPLEDHLLLVCQRYNFSKIFDKEDRRAYFRPNANCPKDYELPDTGWGAPLEGHLAEELAYRRGYDQGFASASAFVPENQLKNFEERSRKIHQWRFARVWYERSQPGDLENWLPRLSYSRSISPKLRYNIFERDGYRCKVCGLGASDGAVLEVDHVIAVSKGGSNDIENLQTLCWACNSGKGNR